MVRLRHNDWEEYITGGKEFQFLYGTIKTGEVISAGAGLIKFQFLYGTIKTVTNNVCLHRMFQISIPVWYD